ncbi:MAG: WG repeat-containing protein [Bacteroidota bacterium]
MMKEMQRLILFPFLLLLLGGCNNQSRTVRDDIYLVAWDNYSFGYIDASGSAVISPQYAYAMPYGEKLAAVNVGGTFNKRRMPTDGKWGFIKMNGEFAINPIYYSPPTVGSPYDPASLAMANHDGYVFSENRAAVRTANEWVYIDRLGNTKIQNNKIKSARAFHDGLANVYMNGRWGYIDTLGNVIIYPQFKYAADFHQGRALVVNEQNEKMIINRRGLRQLPQYRILNHFENGFATVRPYWKGENPNEVERRKTLLINTHGAPMTPKDFDWIGHFGEDMAPALVGSKLGNPISYPQALGPTGEAGGKWGYIDLKGKFKINPAFEDARGFSEGFAAVKNGGLWGYMRPNQSMLTGYEFRWAGFFKNGLAPVILGPIHNDYSDQFAYIDTDGDIIWIEPQPAE